MMEYKGQWLKLQQCAADENFAARLIVIYKNRFPMEVRDSFFEWVESKPWRETIEKEDKGLLGSVWFKEVMTLIEEKINKTGKMMEKISWKDRVEKLEENFKGNEADFVDVVYHCLQQEKLLLESLQQVAGEQVAVNGDNYFHDQQQQLSSQLLPLQQQMSLLEMDVREQENSEKHFTITHENSRVQIQHLSNELQKKDSKSKQKELERLQREIEEGKIEVIRRRMEVFDKLVNTAMALEKNLHPVWQLIDEWHVRQKRDYIGEPSVSPTTLDILNSLCETVNAQLIQLALLVERGLSILSNLLIGEENEPMEKMKKLVKGVHDLFSLHLKRIFVIDRQPQRILKISKCRSLNINMSVRLLGPSSLGLHVYPPKATALLFHENELEDVLNIETKAALDKQKGVCEVVNGKNVPMEVKKSTGHLVGSFNNVQLRGVKKIEKLGKDERVTEKKHGMLFYTQVSIHGKDHLLKVISLPLVLTSQSSQECAAKGTLLWDAAFSEDGRTLYTDPEEVEWEKLAYLLKTHFKKEVEDPGLSDDHLKYIAGRLFDNSESFQNKMIHKDKLFKEKVRGRDFTFWKWFYACINLIKEKISREWKDGLIHGFMSKTQADELLINCSIGTFLLRFSERDIEQTQAATNPGCLCLAVVERDPVNQNKKVFHVKNHLAAKDICGEKSLAHILEAFEVKDPQQGGIKKQLVNTLYPNTPFEKAFGSYLTNTEAEHYGYTPTMFKIEITLGPSSASSRTSYNHSPFPASPATSDCPSNATSDMDDSLDCQQGTIAAAISPPHACGLGISGLTGGNGFSTFGTDGENCLPGFPDLLATLSPTVSPTMARALSQGNVLDEVLMMEEDMGFCQEHVQDVGILPGLLQTSLCVANETDSLPAQSQVLVNPGRQAYPGVQAQSLFIPEVLQ